VLGLFLELQGHGGRRVTFGVAGQVLDGPVQLLAVAEDPGRRDGAGVDPDQAPLAQSPGLPEEEIVEIDRRSRPAGGTGFQLGVQ
jgi:hypothetical protein